MESFLLSAKLQDCYNATSGEDDLTIYCPVIGQACVARYGDMSWYRAQVIGEGCVCMFKYLFYMKLWFDCSTWCLLLLPLM